MSGLATRLVALLAVAAVLAVAPAATGAGQPGLPLRGGTTTLTFDKSFGLSLIKQGVDAYPIAPGVQDSLSFLLPVHDGKMRGRDGYTVIEHRGGLDMTDTPKQNKLTLTNLVVRVNKKNVKLAGLATLNGTEFDTFVFARGTAKTVRRLGDNYVVRGAEMKLNGIGAATLNSQFGTQQFKIGSAIATLDVEASR